MQEATLEKITQNTCLAFCQAWLENTHSKISKTEQQLFVLTEKNPLELKRTLLAQLNTSTSCIGVYQIEDWLKQQIILLWPLVFEALPKSKTKQYPLFWPLQFAHYPQQLGLLRKRFSLRERPHNNRWQQTHFALMSSNPTTPLWQQPWVAQLDKATLSLGFLSTQQQWRLLLYMLKQSELARQLLSNQTLFFQQTPEPSKAFIETLKTVLPKIIIKTEKENTETEAQPPTIITHTDIEATLIETLEQPHFQQQAIALVTESQETAEVLKVQLSQHQIECILIEKTSDSIEKSKWASLVLTHLQLLNNQSITTTQWQQLQTFIFHQAFNLSYTPTHLKQIKEILENNTTEPVQKWLQVITELEETNFSTQFYTVCKKIIYEHPELKTQALPELKWLANQLPLLEVLKPLYDNKATEVWLHWVEAKTIYTSPSWRKLWQKMVITPFDEAEFFETVEHKIVLVQSEKFAYHLRYLLNTENTEKQALKQNNCFILTTPSLKQIIELPPNALSSYKEQLRPEQQQILHLKGKQTAIVAAPGTGKTFVNLALVEAALNDGLKPHQILLVTFMDSAAKHIEERLKQNCIHPQGLPVVSTIHKLAKRILETPPDTPFNWHTENSFGSIKIITEAEQLKCIEAILKTLYPEETQEQETEFVRLHPKGVLGTINQFKNGQVNAKLLQEQLQFYNNNGFASLKRFLPVYLAYENELNENELFDYNDLLQQAIYRLQQDTVLQQSIQNYFNLIIEDEAQDTSQLQNTLIEHLSQASGQQLVRTGDPNQSITQYNGARLADFKHFITHTKTLNNLITLEESPRSAVEIQTVANTLIDWSHSQEATVTPLSETFFNVHLQPVENQNPNLLKPIEVNIFKNYLAEETALIDKALELTKAFPELKQVILCRSNRQIDRLETFLTEQAKVQSIEANAINLMTIHKAKGQEFDVVYLPDLAELTPWISESEKTLCELEALQKIYQQGLAYDYQHQLDQQVLAKTAKTQEELRLFYVAITRAKKSLFLSANFETITLYQKKRPQKPHPFLRYLFEQFKPHPQFLFNDSELNYFEQAEVPQQEAPRHDK